ncbi:hypothetical protein [uncultured Paludibaculum sp.]|uniref:hypothetical protein n=1 Tax=uncultured Paludibaculum sp. TaxID=1765020 RepID=UPI002AAA8BFC|nr:hypothetical protein [uncultured Paludibaculum sp.]
MRQFDGPGGAHCRRIDGRGFRRNDGLRRGFLITNQIRKDRALDGADPGTDPGIVAIESLDQRTLMLADPESGLRHGAVIDAEGLGPELAFQLEEAALVAAQHQAMDREGAELRVNDAGGLFQRLDVEALLDVGGQTEAGRIEAVLAGVARDATLAVGRAGAGGPFGVCPVGGQAAFGDGWFGHGAGCLCVSTAAWP